MKIFDIRFSMDLHVLRFSEHDLAVFRKCLCLCLYVWILQERIGNKCLENIFKIYGIDLLQERIGDKCLENICKMYGIEYYGNELVISVWKIYLKFMV